MPPLDDEDVLGLDPEYDFGPELYDPLDEYDFDPLVDVLGDSAEEPEAEYPDEPDEPL